MIDEMTNIDGQMSLFNEPPLKIHNKVRLIELFSGIGAQAKALERLGVDFDYWRACDIDKYAVASYNAIHGTQFEVGDITKIHAEDLGIVDRDKYTYILTYSFPCQDLSLSGKQKGMSKGSGTRSGLLWEVERLLKECGDNLPQILLMENVAQVISIKNKADFDAWRESLREMGYSNLYQLMNAKYYLIPQNRERCFMLSWLGDYSFEFPNQMPLKKRLKDLLEDNADEKYYLAESTLKYFINNSALQKSLGNGFTFEPTDGNGICKAVTTHMTRMDCTFIDETSKSSQEDIKLMLLGGKGEKKSNSNTQWYQQDRIYSAESVAMAHLAQIPGGSYMYAVNGGLPIKEATQKGYKEAFAGDYVNLQYPQSNTRRGRVGEQVANTLLCNDSNGVVIDSNNCYLSSKGVKYVLDPKRGMCTDINPDVSQTVTALGQQNWTGSFISDDIDYVEKTKTIGDNNPTIIHLKKGEVIDSNCDTSKLRIRKLTPKECFRLMDFDDEDYEKASKVVSNTQIYKQAGNSIVVNVLVAIFGQLFEGKEDIYKQR